MRKLVRPEKIRIERTCATAGNPKMCPVSPAEGPLENGGARREVGGIYPRLDGHSIALADIQRGRGGPEDIVPRPIEAKRLAHFGGIVGPSILECSLVGFGAIGCRSITGPPGPHSWPVGGSVSSH